MSCLCTYELFDAINTEHLSTGHGARDITHNKTEFVVLRPLYHKTAEEVAEELIEIFCIFGSPHILQSDNGREFSNKIVKKIVAMGPGCKLVHGKPQHSQSQGSVERANRDIEAILACWMKDNGNTNWSGALRFVQWQKNCRPHSGIGRSPYEAMFGKKHVGSASMLPNDVWKTLETEEDLLNALNEDESTERETNETEEGPSGTESDFSNNDGGGKSDQQKYIDKYLLNV